MNSPVTKATMRCRTCSTDSASANVRPNSRKKILPRMSICGSADDYLVFTRFSSLFEEAVMKYLCLIYDEEKSVAGMSKAEGDAFMGEYFAFTDGIKKSGHYLGGEALQPVHTATTVRVRNGKMTTTDGPFAETKEQLGGFYMIEARDLNEALQVAAKIPSVRTGSIEIRPVVDFSQPDAQALPTHETQSTARA